MKGRGEIYWRILARIQPERAKKKKNKKKNKRRIGFQVQTTFRPFEVFPPPLPLTLLQEITNNSPPSPSLSLLYIII